MWQSFNNIVPAPLHFPAQSAQAAKPQYHTHLHFYKWEQCFIAPSSLNRKSSCGCRFTTFFLLYGLDCLKTRFQLLEQINTFIYRLSQPISWRVDWLKSTLSDERKLKFHIFWQRIRLDAGCQTHAFKIQVTAIVMFHTNLFGPSAGCNSVLLTLMLRWTDCPCYFA
jgi:hypothetical protein